MTRKIRLGAFLPGGGQHIASWRHPDQVPAADPPSSFMAKVRQSGSLIPCAALIVFICWVLIAGYATATECAAYGVLGSLLLATWSRSLTWDNFREGLMSTARTSCMIMFILAGAAFLTKTMAFTGIPKALAEWVAAMNPNPYMLIAVLAAAARDRAHDFRPTQPLRRETDRATGRGRCCPRSLF